MCMCIYIPNNGAGLVNPQEAIHFMMVNSLQHTQTHSMAQHTPRV